MSIFINETSINKAIPKIKEIKNDLLKGCKLNVFFKKYHFKVLVIKIESAEAIAAPTSPYKLMKK